MMDFFEAVKKRGSYRNEFDQTQVSDEELNMILDAGVRAPSGGNLQTPVFYAVRNEELRKKIAEVFPTPATKTASVIIVVTSRIKAYSEYKLHFEVEDYAAAVENILLAITALGYAGVWMDGMMRIDGNTEKIRKILQIPEEETIRTIIPFGHPVQPVVQKEKLPLSDRIHIL